LLEAIERLVELNPSESLKLWEQGARDLSSISEEERAVLLWEQLLRQLPEHQEAQKAIGQYAERRKNWDLKVTQLEAQIRSARNPEEEAALLCELGKLHRERREDPQAAREAFLKASEVVPDEITALEALVDLAQAQDDGETIIHCVDRLLGRLEREAEPALKQELGPRIAVLLPERARLAQEMGDEETALRCLSDAHELAPQNTELGQALADLLFERGDLRAAAVIYGRIPLPKPPAGVEPEAFKATEQLRRAQAYQWAGEYDRAAHYYEGAARFKLSRVEALKSLAGLQESAQRWEAAIRAWERLAQAQSEPAQVGLALATAGRIAELRLKKIGRTILLYERALRAGLEERTFLREILHFYAQHRRSASLEIVERLLEGEEDANQLAALWSLKGDLLAERRQLPQARQAWLKALEEAPGMVSAARGLLNYLEGDAEGVLERIRFAANELRPADRLPILELLGEQLQELDSDAALSIYEEILALDGGHVKARAALAQIHGRLLEAGDGEHLHRAISHRMAYLRAVPGDPEALRDLIKLLRAAGEPHHIPLRLLAWLDQADLEEQEEADRIQGLSLDQMLLDNNRRTEWIAGSEWRMSAGTLLKNIHEWIAPELDSWMPPSELDAEPADLIDPPLAEMAEQLCRLLELPPRRIWLRSTSDPRLGLRRIHPPEFIAGGGLSQGLSPASRRFHLGRALELSRGAAIFASLLSLDSSRALFAAAVNLALPQQGLDFGAAMGIDEEALIAWTQLLNISLPPKHVESLARAAGPVIAAGPKSFEEWAQLSRMSANRVGFILSGDLVESIAAMGAHPESPEYFRARLKENPALEDLYLYAFSDRFRGLLSLMINRS